MKGYRLKGKTIAKVHQSLLADGEHTPRWVLDAIEFTDGSVLRFTVMEAVGEYGVIGVYPGHEIAS